MQEKKTLVFGRALTVVLAAAGQRRRYRGGLAVAGRRGVAAGHVLLVPRQRAGSEEHRAEPAEDARGRHRDRAHYSNLRRGYEDRYIDYLSPEWTRMLDHLVATADKLGMQIDMTTGTGWCFGGPVVNDN